MQTYTIHVPRKNKTNTQAENGHHPLSYLSDAPETFYDLFYFSNPGKFINTGEEKEKEKHVQFICF